MRSPRLERFCPSGAAKAVAASFLTPPHSQSLCRVTGRFLPRKGLVCVSTPWPWVRPRDLLWLKEQGEVVLCRLCRRP